MWSIIVNSCDKIWREPMRDGRGDGTKVRQPWGRGHTVGGVVY